jgi:cytochrome c556
MARSAATIVAWACAGLGVVAAGASAAPGETGPAEIMAARRALMVEIERLMKPIDSFTVGEPAEPAALASAASSIEAMLLAVPHLFPPATNRFDPADAATPTLALPSVWQQWDTFVQLDAASGRAAADLAAADGAEAVRAAALKLRGTCDACHATFTRPYVPEAATDADRDFDFDSVLPK